MRIARSLALVIMALLILSTPAMAQKGQFAVPQDSLIGEFKIYDDPKPLTVGQMAFLGLHPVRLERPTVVQNHYRGLHGKEGRFVVEKLPAGTLVLVDKYDNIRFKADCGNRLIEFENVAINRKPAPPAEVKPDPKPTTPPQNVFKNNESGLWKGLKALWGHFIDVLRPMANWLGWFMGWGATWIMIALLLFALYESARGWGQEPGYAPLPGTAPRPAQQVVSPGTSTATKPLPAVQSAPAAVAAPTATSPVANEASSSGTQRAFITHSAGSGSNPNLLRWGGLDFHSLEVTSDGVHSLRYHHKQATTK